ncbi:MAG: FKBP-type peptidyl-prolyl cis-trans isomerase [Saccharospirillaceae bacterium]|nr:FKBP-type peptidyl-prolyl cis-trans isomerase [Pseudomonadales bacterium]NRB78784.1 FKBP-type peptidyl-prolyl cis-trans isomerase [Saccharospirillaceae bacterium]
MSYKLPEQQASYGIGRNFGDQLSANPFEGLDIQALIQGVQDSFAGTESVVPQEDLEKAFQMINEQMQSKQAEQSKEQSAEGTLFLEENAKRDGVIVTDSGLQYEVLTTGEGAIPTASDTVSTHYHGTLINGEVFDSSYDRGQPAEFPVGGVIAGWTEALLLMTTGSKWRLTIPYNLAYGEQGAGGKIGPFATLIFDIELLEIK